MLFIISPAKTLDFSKSTVGNHSIPQLLGQSGILIDELKTKDAAAIKSLMKVSDKIAELNVARYKAFTTPFTLENSKQALLAFKGDVYLGLDAVSFDEKDLGYAQEHLRILSGLYGILKPLDLMQPYRLEMGTRLQNERGKNLYEFWGERITELLNQELKQQKKQIIVNLASKEYFKAVKQKALQAEVYNIAFKENKGDQYKIVAFFAKKARGMMCHYAVKNQITQVEDLKGFDYDGYFFNADLSSEKDWVFTR